MIVCETAQAVRASTTHRKHAGDHYSMSTQNNDETRARELVRAFGMRSFPDPHDCTPAERDVVSAARQLAAAEEKLRTAAEQLHRDVTAIERALDGADPISDSEMNALGWQYTQLISAITALPLAEREVQMTGQRYGDERRTKGR